MTVLENFSNRTLKYFIICYTLTVVWFDLLWRFCLECRHQAELGCCSPASVESIHSCNNQWLVDHISPKPRITHKKTSTRIRFMQQAVDRLQNAQSTFTVQQRRNIRQLGREPQRIPEYFTGLWYRLCGYGKFCTQLGPYIFYSHPYPQGRVRVKGLRPVAVYPYPWDCELST